MFLESVSSEDLSSFFRLCIAEWFGSLETSERFSFVGEVCAWLFQATEEESALNPRHVELAYDWLIEVERSMGRADYPRFGKKYEQRKKEMRRFFSTGETKGDIFLSFLAEVPKDLVSEVSEIKIPNQEESIDVSVGRRPRGWSREDVWAEKMRRGQIPCAFTDITLYDQSFPDRFDIIREATLFLLRGSSEITELEGKEVELRVQNPRFRGKKGVVRGFKGRRVQVEVGGIQILVSAVMLTESGVHSSVVTSSPSRNPETQGPTAGPSTSGPIYSPASSPPETTSPSTSGPTRSPSQAETQGPTMGPSTSGPT